MPSFSQGGTQDTPFRGDTCALADTKKIISVGLKSSVISDLLISLSAMTFTQVH